MMTKLSKIMPEKVISITGNIDINISGIAYDSRKVREGFLFVALAGQNVDGNAFLFDAIERGAAAIITEGNRKNIEIPVIKVDNARAALSEISKKYFNDPSSKLKLIGITGTKGKTTISYMTQAILKQAYEKAFRIGTVEYDMDYAILPAANTTPESLVISSLLNSALDHNINAGVIEVSSHSLKNHRVDDISFCSAGFTNLSLEHTEFHPDMDDYFLTKSTLFLERGTKEKPCVIGIDDDYGTRLAKKCKADGKNVITVSIVNPEADIFAKAIEMSGMKTHFSIVYKNSCHECNISLAGSFNVFNALMAAGLCHSIGIEWNTIITGLESVKRVPGRFESIKNSNGFNVIVDYAHSPAAMENVLKTVRPFTNGRVITVFGCGGNRSHEKRPIMGKIAYQNSEITIVTSDNPRKENPSAIIEQILDGINSEKKIVGKEVYSEADRLEAIKMALKSAKSGDTVVIAGKGHETGQTFADKTIPFDDREVVRAFFRGDDEV